MTSSTFTSPLASKPARWGAIEYRWNTKSIYCGAIVWVACLTAAALGWMRIGAAECLFLLAPLVTVPLGLRLALGTHGQGIARPLFRLTLALQPVAAVLVAAGFALPPGRWAGGLAAVWLGETALIGLCGLVGLVQAGIPFLERACLNLGLIYLPFGGFWLVASRLGLSPAGFKEPIVFFTAVHFHYAAFAAPVFAGMTGIALRATSGARRKFFPVAAGSVMAAPALLAAGWALGSPLLKVVAAFALAAGLLVLVVLTFYVTPHFRHALAGALMVVSGLSVVAGMCLVCVYAGGEFVGAKLISIPQMAVSHGVLNSLGFTCCGLLAWTIEQNHLANRDPSELMKKAQTSKGAIEA